MEMHWKTSAKCSHLVLDLNQYNGLVQYCNIHSVLAMEILQSSTKPWKWHIRQLEIAIAETVILLFYW